MVERVRSDAIVIRIWHVRTHHAFSEVGDGHTHTAIFAALLQHARRQCRLVDEAVCMHAAAEAVFRFPCERVDLAKQTVWVGLFVRATWPAEQHLLERADVCMCKFCAGHKVGDDHAPALQQRRTGIGVE
eukprot:36456-Chlamydomonas_euryale.AAC.2